jgi:hypothetical protein
MLHYPHQAGQDQSQGQAILASVLELLSRKKALKQQLKNLMPEYARMQGHGFKEAEKKPIRSLLKNYNALIFQIEIMMRDQNSSKAAEASTTKARTLSSGDTQGSRKRRGGMFRARNHLRFTMETTAKSLKALATRAKSRFQDLPKLFLTLRQRSRDKSWK